MPAGIDMTGKTLGRLYVVREYTHDPKRKGRYWLCQCECDNQVIVPTGELRRKWRPTRSCGCLRADVVSGNSKARWYGRERRKCNHCGTAYQGKNHQKYCSQLCNQAAYRKRVKAAE